MLAVVDKYPQIPTPQAGVGRPQEIGSALASRHPQKHDWMAGFHGTHCKREPYERDALER